MTIDSDGWVDRFSWIGVKADSSTTDGDLGGPYLIRSSGDSFELVLRRRITSTGELLRLIADALDGETISSTTMRGRVVGSDEGQLVLAIDGQGECRYRRSEEQ